MKGLHAVEIVLHHVAAGEYRVRKRTAGERRKLHGGSGERAVGEGRKIEHAQFGAQTFRTEIGKRAVLEIAAVKSFVR